MESEQRALTDSLKTFGNLISKLEVNLNGGESEDDTARLAELEQIRKEVSNKVLAHKKLIADEYKAMRITKDTAKLEAEKAEKTRESESIKGENKNKMEVYYKGSIYLTTHKDDDM